MNVSKYAKAWTALTAGALAWGATVVSSSSSSITGAEWIGAAGIVVAALGVFFVPNTNSPPPA